MLNAQSILSGPRTSGQPDQVAGVKFGEHFKQLLLDFEAHHGPAPDAQDNRLPEPPASITLSWLVPVASQPEEPEQPGKDVSVVSVESQNIRIDENAYIKLPLELLHTCAQDLLHAERLFANPKASAKQLLLAAQLKEDTLAWLNGAPALFEFNSCIQLLEEELIRSANGDVIVPALSESIDAIANWIKNDPQCACTVLEGYQTMFKERAEEASQKVIYSMAQASRRDRAC